MTRNYRINKTHTTFNNLLRSLTIFTLTVLIVIACSQSRIKHDQEDSIESKIDSTAYMNDKTALADEIDGLMNSIDTLIFRANERKKKSKKEVQDQLEAAIHELMLHKDRVDRERQEVQTTALKGWDEDYVQRIKTTLDEIKSDVEHIKTASDIGD